MGYTPDNTFFYSGSNIFLVGVHTPMLSSHLCGRVYLIKWRNFPTDKAPPHLKHQRFCSNESSYTYMCFFSSRPRGSPPPPDARFSFFSKMCSHCKISALPGLQDLIERFEREGPRPARYSHLYTHVYMETRTVLP